MNKKPIIQAILLVLIPFYLVSCLSPTTVLEITGTPQFPTPVSTRVIRPKLETQKPARTATPSTTAKSLLSVTSTFESQGTKTEASPEPGWIAFTWFSDDASESEIYKIRTDGSGLENLTNSPGFDQEPAWSPDGSQIAFNSNRDGEIRLYTMDENGNNVIRLSEMAPIFTRPSWSPDGQKLAFASTDLADRSDIYIIDLKSSQIENITNSPYVETGPEWSPDGRKIFFHACSDSNLMDEFVEECFIDVLDFITKSVLRLDNTTDTMGLSQWSPDGTKIATSCNLNLCIINADGSGRVEFDKEVFRIDVQEPTWSPDGHRLAFRSLKDLDEAIYILDLKYPSAISNVVRLTPPNLDGGVYAPDWRP